MERLYLRTLRSWRYYAFNLIMPHRRSDNSHASDITSPFITATLLLPSRCQTHRGRYWDRGEESESDRMRQGATKRDRDTWRAKAIQSTLLHNHGWQEKMRLYIIWWNPGWRRIYPLLKHEKLCLSHNCDRQQRHSLLISHSSTAHPWYAKDTRFWKNAKKLPRGKLDGAIVRLKLALTLSRW